MGIFEKMISVFSVFYLIIEVHGCLVKGYLNMLLFILCLFIFFNR